jgi:hypothetical protein
MYYGSSQHGIKFSFLFIIYFWGEGEGGRATFVYGHSNVTSDCEIAHVLLGFSKEGEELTTVGSTHFPWGQGFVKLLATSHHGLVPPKKKKNRVVGYFAKMAIDFHS